MDALRTYAKGMAHVLMFLGLVTAVGCAPGRSHRPSTAFVATRGIRLIVDNRDWQDAQIYVLRGGQRIRVGTVPAVTRQVLIIRNSIIGGLGEVQLSADPIGSRWSHTSDRIIVPESGSIHWQVQLGMRTSWLSIRR